MIENRACRSGGILCRFLIKITVRPTAVGIAHYLIHVNQASTSKKVYITAGIIMVYVRLKTCY